MTDPTVGDTSDVTALSYTEASRELDRIVQFFEQRDVDVDLLVTQLQRATDIVDELDRRIRRTRAQVEVLVPRLEAAASDDVGDEEDDVEDDAGDEMLEDDDLDDEDLDDVGDRGGDTSLF